jgi:Serine hydrolase (FSH1)
MQMAAFKYNVGLDTSFVTAPFPATGPPDPGIAMFYPNHDYFEWVVSKETMEGLHTSMELIADYISQNGPFDAILGFSQGAAMATRVVLKRLGLDNIKCVLLVGGVPPAEIDHSVKISIPSLHIMGLADLGTHFWVTARRWGPCTTRLRS